MEVLASAFHLLSAFPEETDQRKMFELKTKSGIRRIPYHQIYYFEAKDKKLNVHLSDTEFSFQGTLAKIEVILPQEFLRCHKSFIVNSEHILSIRYDLQYIELDEQLQIPYSRGYRKSFMESYYGKRS